eukprot:1183010-Prorocentrum_minimum.AAC.1
MAVYRQGINVEYSVERRIFRGIFEMPCAEWYTSVVDSRQLSTVELKSKAFLAVGSGAWPQLPLDVLVTW